MPFWVVPAAIAAIQGISSLIAANRQKKANKEMAAFQADANQQIVDRQNAYNSPKAQMARFGDAGLNPNLIYGQGNPGNQSSAPSYPDVKIPDYQSITANMSPQFNQSLMTQSQVAAIDAKTIQTYGMVELNKLQGQLIKANPLLNDAGFKATIQSLISSAQLKATDVKMADSQLNVQQITEGSQAAKLFREVQVLEQRFNLGTADLALKAEVLKGKEFQNAILEVQKKFMTDGNITPQHIVQFIQMLLLKLF